MESIAASAIPRLSEFAPRHCANTVWAFATLGLSHEPLLSALSAESMGKIAWMSPLSLASTAWAFATLEWRDQPLLSALSAASLPTLGREVVIDEGVAGMALWAASRLDDKSLAWKMLDQTRGISLLNFSCLLEACEQVGDWKGECRLLWDVQAGACGNMHGAVVNAMGLQMLSLGSYAEAFEHLSDRLAQVGTVDEASGIILGCRIRAAAETEAGFTISTRVQRIEGD